MSFTDHMRTNDPATTVAPATPERRREILDGARAANSSRHPRRSAGRTVAAVAVAAALAVGTLTVQGLLGDPAEARAQQVLTEAAINAVDPPTEPGQYWEITATQVGLMSVCPTYEAVECFDAYIGRRTWTRYTAVDGASPSWIVEGAEELVEQLDPRWEGVAPEPEIVWTGNITPNDFPGSWQVPSPAWAAGLPRDPAALRALLYRDSNGTDESALTYAADALRSGRLPADLRSALFTVMADIPGVRVVDESAVIDGRVGVAITHEDDGNLRELLIDPAEGQLIGERNRPGDDHYADRGLGTSYTRALVDGVPADVMSRAEHRDCWIDDDNSTNCPM